MSLSTVITEPEAKILSNCGIAKFNSVVVEGGCDPQYLNDRMVTVIARGKGLRLQLQYVHARVAYAERVGAPVTGAHYGWLLRAMLESSADIYLAERKMLEEEWCWNEQQSLNRIVSLQEIGNLFKRIDPQKYECTRKRHESRQEVRAS
jgi:hypothetical protein